MWPFLRKLLVPVRNSVVTNIIDFREPRLDHWASFEGGDNFDARFSIRGRVAKGDEIIVRMRSGRSCSYQLFSVRPDFTRDADWVVRGCVVGWFQQGRLVPEAKRNAGPSAQRLLGSGSGGIQSYPSELAPLSDGFTYPTSEFWKIRARNEACSARANQLRATGNL